MASKKLSHRRTRRTVSRDALALVSWPWLGDLGAVIDELFPPVRPGRPRRFDGSSLLLLVALRWRAHSLDQAEGHLRLHWEEVRRHGLQHGLSLPEHPPRWEYLRQLRELPEFPDLLKRLDEPFIVAAVETALAVRLMPERVSEVIVPHRDRHLQGDGTTFRPQTKVTVDENGEIHGSRAHRLPARVPDQIHTTKNGAQLTGYPLVAWTLHGRQRWERVVMAIAAHPNGDEIIQAEAALHRVLDHTQQVATVSYDRLMMGACQQRIMRRGVLPIVERAQASSSVTDPRKCVRLPDELVPVRGSKTAKSRRKGKGRRRRSSDAPTEKRFLAVAQLPDAVHDGPTGPCRHQLAAIDTCLVVHDGGTDANWWHRTEVPPVHRVERVDRGDGTFSLIGVWKLRCEHMDRANRYFEHRIDLSGKHGASVTANRVNAYPYLHPQSSGLYGWRNDIESFFHWLKDLSPEFGRSTSLRYNDLILDVIGAGILNNAVIYDIRADETDTPIL